jgi:hypothetical protein
VPEALLIALASAALALDLKLWMENRRLSTQVLKGWEQNQRMVEWLLQLRSQEHGVYLPTPEPDAPLPEQWWSFDGLVSFPTDQQDD